MGQEGKFMQKRFVNVWLNTTDTGTQVSCQVFQRYLSCCRSLPYLLSEAIRWFHLTCSVLSSALLGVDCHGAHTDSLNHTYLQIPKQAGWLTKTFKMMRTFFGVKKVVLHILCRQKALCLSQACISAFWELQNWIPRSENYKERLFSIPLGKGRSYHFTWTM